MSDDKKPTGRKRLKLEVEHVADLKAGAIAQTAANVGDVANRDKVRSKDNWGSSCGPVSK